MYPIPLNLLIETWPHGTGGLTLDEWQRDLNDTGGDRHATMVQPATNAIWETWLTRLVGSEWEASNCAKFSLDTNALRPVGWTSGDAAGLPMFPAIVRYDECERGWWEHDFTRVPQSPSDGGNQFCRCEILRRLRGSG